MKSLKLKSFSIILLIALSFSLFVPVMVSADDETAVTEETGGIISAEEIARTDEVAPPDDNIPQDEPNYYELEGTTTATDYYKSTSISLEKTLKIVALGDSIPARYGVTADEGCIAQLSKLLTSKDINNSVVNLSENGATAATILTLLETDRAQAAIKDADAVTINVGTNDILLPFLNYILNVSELMNRKYFGGATINFNIQYSDINNDLSNVSYSLSTIEKAFEIGMTEETLADIDVSLEKFAAELGEIIAKVNELAPDAVIYVSTIYNPAAKKLSVYEKINSTLDKLNAVITAGAENEAYKVVDTASVFAASDKKLTEFDIVNKLYNLFPNRHGHIEISKLYFAAITGKEIKPATVSDVAVETPEAVEETPVAEEVESADESVDENVEEADADENDENE